MTHQVGTSLVVPRVKAHERTNARGGGGPHPVNYMNPHYQHTICCRDKQDNLLTQPISVCALA